MSSTSTKHIDTQEIVSAIVDDKKLSDEQLKSLESDIPSDSNTRSLIHTAVNAIKESSDTDHRIQALRVLSSLSHNTNLASLLLQAEALDTVLTLATDIPPARPYLASIAQSLPVDTLLHSLVPANSPLAAAALLHCQSMLLRYYAAHTLYRLAASAAGAVRIMESAGDLLRSAVVRRPVYDVLAVIAHLLAVSAGNNITALDPAWWQLVVDTLESSVPLSAAVQESFLRAIAAVDPPSLPRHTLSMLAPMMVCPNLSHLVSDTVEQLLPSADDVETSTIAWCNSCLLEAIIAPPSKQPNDGNDLDNNNSNNKNDDDNNHNNNTPKSRSHTRKESVRFRLTVPWSTVLAQPAPQRTAAVLALSTRDPYRPVLSAVQRFPRQAMERVPQGVVVSVGEQAAVWVDKGALHVNLCVRDGAVPGEDAMVRAMLEGEGWTARRGRGSGRAWEWIGGEGVTS
eukprot:gb/GECH01012050.1/.p1 GENE.gb/GECH01012050.1/~~gb/GECH01012050.1/.p1  ORF type:complete len:456 (+),score=127.41 gb/GECH01012050.1/:1-1368(+)